MFSTPIFDRLLSKECLLTPEGLWEHPKCLSLFLNAEARGGLRKVTQRVEQSYFFCVLKKLGCSRGFNMTQPKINLNHLKQYLKNCSQEELVSDIAELFKKFPSVKDYYQIKLYPQEEKEIAAKYKKIIESEFFPSRGLGKARLSVAKKAISDYKKVCQTDAALIDVMLFYVEQGVKFTKTEIYEEAF
ncbi:MAG: hypothetical protein C6Y22_14150 [Hapalosiphonaceae cyanobacterium JJU2]|nr:MAG: hypothetical protein C6Y22_14150 [Hapalosiphonaceae cyanobacterium JJU2]